MTIKYAKYKDLMDKVVNTGVLPDEYKTFYENLQHDGPKAQPKRHARAEDEESDDDSDGDDYMYD